jgi:PPM family protein phosphatase
MPPSGSLPDTENGGFQGRLEVESLSDQGLRRMNNQDSMAVVLAPSESVWQQRGDLLMVADGMGAHAAGERASKLSVDYVPLNYQKLADRTPAEALLAAMEEANAQIHSRGQASIDFKGMGTTTTALALLPFGALAAHVGDSRAYRLRGTRFEQLTFDHSLVWEMRAAGLPEYGPKNVITRSLGPSPSVKVDIEGPHPIVPGDTFLLCSDGLSGPVKDDEMGMVLGSMPPAEAARALVDLANMRGGPDNVTVIVAKTVGPLWSQAASDMPQPRAPLRPIHSTVWIAFGVLLLAGLLLLWMQQWIPAALGLVAAAVLGIGAWFYRQGGEVEGPEMSGNRYGRGPYAAVVCPPSQEFAQRLAETLRELREVAARDEWTFDAAAFNALHDRAVAASQSGEFAQAVRHYCQSISYLVAEGKRQCK